MSTPLDLVLVRHGQSEQNLAASTDAADGRRGLGALEPAPAYRWPLTDLGRAQATAIGIWIRSELGGFDGYYVSPYVRARETAGLLGLPGAGWRVTRTLRERDWGDIESLPAAEFNRRPEYTLNATVRRIDPLYWTAPNGESVARVAGDRVETALSEIRQGPPDARVIAVTHGEWMWAARLVLQHWTDEEYTAHATDPADGIANGQAEHYTRTDPRTGAATPWLSWVRTARPTQAPHGRWTVDVTPWHAVGEALLSNDDLLAGVAATVRHHDDTDPPKPPPETAAAPGTQAPAGDPAGART